MHKASLSVCGSASTIKLSASSQSWELTASWNNRPNSILSCLLSFFSRSIFSLLPSSESIAIPLDLSFLALQQQEVDIFYSFLIKGPSLEKTTLLLSPFSSADLLLLKKKRKAPRQTLLSLFKSFSPLTFHHLLIIFLIFPTFLCSPLLLSFFLFYYIFILPTSSSLSSTSHFIPLHLLLSFPFFFIFFIFFILYIYILYF